MVDVQAQISAVDRGLTTVDVDGHTMRTQTLGQTYRAPIDDVWDAITNAERIPRWFLPISGDLRLGGSYQLEGNAGGVVEDCSPPKDGTAHFRATWVFGGGTPPMLTIRLTALDPATTRLDLNFTGDVADLPDGMWEQFGPAATGMGWDSGLLGLALHLGSGDAEVTPETAAAWTVSDEGKSFMRLSADAWQSIHIGSGGDPDVAKAAADATYAMYTGG